ncbi:MAG: DUF2232 domain-containing protein [Gemmatimonadota bacterium]
MEEAVASGRGRWSTAIGLTLVVLLLSVFDALALVLLPLAILLVGWPSNRHWKWVAAGVLLWAVGLVVAGGGLVILSRGWALMLGATYLALTLVRPQWDVTSRALGAVAVALTVGSLGLLASGQAAELDTAIRTHFETISALTIGDLQTRMPDSTWVADLRSATERISSLQAEMFPALLSLQSLAALALVSWWIRWLGRSKSEAFALHRLRDFRFNDQLIWVLIAAVLLYLAPLTEPADRIAVNAIVFMAALYAFRGLAIFVFLAAGSRSIPTMVLGVVALVFLYPVAFTAALMMGLGDTWLDVRRRVASANPT